MLGDHLVPAMQMERAGDIAIVSHGIILSQLWRCFLNLFAKSDIVLAPGLSVDTGRATTPEYLGGWSNTGYLELEILKKDSAATGELAITAAAPPTHAPFNASDTSSRLDRSKLIIKTVNGKEHLKGLKRTRGVGSSKFDEDQKSIESFFKKRKMG